MEERSEAVGRTRLSAGQRFDGNEHRTAGGRRRSDREIRKASLSIKILGALGVLHLLGERHCFEFHSNFGNSFEAHEIVDEIKGRGWWTAPWIQIAAAQAIGAAPPIILQAGKAEKGGGAADGDRGDTFAPNLFRNFVIEQNEMQFEINDGLGHAVLLSSGPVIGNKGGGEGGGRGMGGLGIFGHALDALFGHGSLMSSGLLRSITEAEAAERGGRGDGDEGAAGYFSKGSALSKDAAFAQGGALSLISGSGGTEVVVNGRLSQNVGSNGRGGEKGNLSRNSQMMELDASSHGKFLKANPTSLVLYYVPWCSWCLRFLPIFDELASTAQAQFRYLHQAQDTHTQTKRDAASIVDEAAEEAIAKKVVAFGRIDLNRRVNRVVQEEEGVMQFPTLRLYTQNGSKVEEFDDDFTLVKTMKWLLAKTTSDLEVRSLMQLKELLKIHRTDVVVLLANPTKSMLQIERDVLLKKFEDVMFGTVSDPNVAKDLLQYALSSDLKTQRGGSQRGGSQSGGSQGEEDVLGLREKGWPLTEHVVMARELSRKPDSPFLIIINPHTVVTLPWQSSDQIEARDNRSSNSASPSNSESLSTIGKQSTDADPSITLLKKSLDSLTAFPIQRPSHFDHKIHIMPAAPRDAWKLENAAETEAFIRKFQNPIITRWSPLSSQKVIQGGRPFLVAFTDLLDETQAETETDAAASWGAAASHGVEGAADGRTVAAVKRAMRYTRLGCLEDLLWELSTTHRSEVLVMASGTRRMYEKRLIDTLALDDHLNHQARNEVAGEETEEGVRGKGGEGRPRYGIAYVTMNPSGSGVFAPMLKYLAPSEIEDAIFETSVFDPRELARTITKAKQWLGDVKAGKIPPYIKSEDPLPDELNVGPVYALSGSDFARHVGTSPQGLFSSPKNSGGTAKVGGDQGYVAHGKAAGQAAEKVDYLVDFHAPFCGHCRLLAPIYYRVARAFKQAGISTVKFGRMDATANEVPGLRLHGYPTLILFPAGRKDTPRTFRGGVEGPTEIIDFLAATVTHQFDKEKVLHALHHLNDEDELPELDPEL